MTTAYKVRTMGNQNQNQNSLLIPSEIILMSNNFETCQRSPGSITSVQETTKKWKFANCERKLLNETDKAPPYDL